MTTRVSGWFGRLKDGLARSATRLGEGIAGILASRRLDKDALRALEELLIEADLGPAMAAKLTQELARKRLDQDVTATEVRELLAADIAAALAPLARPLALVPGAKPTVVLVVGVNGSGKTTTIGKLARLFVNDGHSVLMAAGDTFRAAAVEQLKIWGARLGVAVVTRGAGADPAGLAYDAFAEARREGTDVLLVDTAGRLHNKTNLMAELQKVVRVLKKMDPAAPHHCLLVLDATVGQNALQQVETFKEMTDLTGLVVTKLDGTARCGVLVALAERFRLPIHCIGVGEGADDLRPFEADAFARALLGLAARE